MRHLLRITILVYISITGLAGCDRSDNINTGGIAVPKVISATAFPAGSMTAYLYVDQALTPLATQELDFANNQSAVSFDNIPITPGAHMFTIAFKYQSTTVPLITLASAVTTDPVNVVLATSTTLNFNESDYAYLDDDMDSINNIAEINRCSDPRVVNRAPMFTLTAPAFSINENTTPVGRVSATDPDQDPLQFAIAASDDQALFNITESGVLSFNIAPDFEIPRDVGMDNVYQLVVSVTDGILNEKLALTITVNNQDDPLLLTPVLNVSLGPKQLEFTWTASQGATRYQLSENRDGDSGFSVIAPDLSVLTYRQDIAVHLLDWLNVSYIVEACDGDACTSSNEVSIAALMLESIAYFKASNTGGGTGIVDNGDKFGSSVALSADGKTLAVGALGEDSAAVGVNDTSIGQDDNIARDSGAVYVFIHVDGIWRQQAYVKASNTSGRTAG